MLSLESSSHLFVAKKEPLKTSATSQLARDIRRFEKNEAQVIRHVAAHVAAGRQYTSSPQYDFVNSIEGQRFITAGEVSFDTSPIQDNPSKSLAKAMDIRDAALAPLDLSLQDISVSQHALTMALAARVDIRNANASPLGTQVDTMA